MPKNRRVGGREIGHSDGREGNFSVPSKKNKEGSRGYDHGHTIQLDRVDMKKTLDVGIESVHTASPTLIRDRRSTLESAIPTPDQKTLT